MRKVELTNGVHDSPFSSSRYVTEAVKNVERQLAKKILSFHAKRKLHCRHLIALK